MVSPVTSPQHRGDPEEQATEHPYPEIELEVMVDNGVVSLTRREADIVLRLSTAPPTQLVGRRVTPLFSAVYGSPGYLRGLPRPLDLTTLDWVRWDDAWKRVPTERWIDEHVAPERVRARISTSLALTELVAAGLGVGFHPCWAGDADPRLERAAPPRDFGFALWLLTHEDLRRTTRIRALMRFLGDALAAERSRFLGEDPS